MRKEILTAGAGWITAGLICISVWAIEKSFTNPIGLLYVGLLVIIIGGWLLIVNKKLNAMMIKMEADAKKRTTSKHAS